MKKSLLSILLIGIIVGGTAFAQDLKIDYQYNVAAADSGNYFSFSGPIRYMAADKDTYDAASGASVQLSTERFQAYMYDVKGMQTFPSGLRGLFLFAVAPSDYKNSDNVTVNKASDGTITIQFVHRGTAYRIVTDSNGRLSFPRGNFAKRTVGYIQGAGPQVLSSDYSSNGTAARIDWNKVWNPNSPSGREIKAGVATKTGPIQDDNGLTNALFGWSGVLNVSFERNILKIQGGLNAVKR